MKLKAFYCNSNIIITLLITLPVKLFRRVNLTFKFQKKLYFLNYYQTILLYFQRHICRLSMSNQLIFFNNKTYNFVNLFSSVFHRRVENVPKLQARLGLGQEPGREIGSERRGSVFRKIPDQPEPSPASDERLELPSVHLRSNAHPIPVPSVVGQI